MMTRRRWIADEVHGDVAALVGEHALHLARVLRAKVGQEFDILTGESVRRGRITHVSDERVEFELGSPAEAVDETELTLLLAVFKFDRFEWALEKCTELGASRIVPLLARRTDANLAKAAEKRIERWRRIARESAEQSRRIAPPEITGPMKLKQALGIDSAIRTVLSENEKITTLREVVETNADADSLALAIGPEGGWSEEELKAFASAGWISAALGETILRAETAAMAATAVVRMLAKAPDKK
jgi:16S rRNA (uracil1498-N3)-methyltransferase